MPYVNKTVRDALNPHVDRLIEQHRLHGFVKGDLNYCMTLLVKAYIEHHGVSYDTLSDMTGVLNDVKTEFERRVVAPYEDKKIEENGDVRI